MTLNMIKHRSNCRLCNSKQVIKIFDLGEMPLAGNFLSKNEIGKEKKYPLRVFFCKNCSLVQVLDIIPKEELFTKYFYLSSVTKTLSNHFKEYAKEMVNRFLIPGKSFVLEIGSNDGVLQEPLEKLDIKTLGIEPAVNISRFARKKGLEVINDYFSKKLAEKIKKERGQVDAIFANNVFAHMDSIRDVTKGIKLLLKKDGIFVFEVHYIVDLIEKLQYDTIYHEHMCYYSLTSLSKFFESFNMEIFDVKKIPIHAGSIRIYVKNKDQRLKNISKNVKKILKYEKDNGFDSLQRYLNFSIEVRNHRDKLKKTLTDLKKKNKKIVGYGAPGRGNILLNYCSLGPDILDYIIDESPIRKGMFIPGMHIPIISPEKFRKNNPDYALILAWSYKQEIFKKEKKFIENGGKFIIPLPKIKQYP